MDKLNIILDLDECLLHSILQDLKESNYKEYASYQTKMKKVGFPSFFFKYKFDGAKSNDYSLTFTRPHLQEFITYLFKHYNVSVWSNGYYTYVDKTLNEVGLSHHNKEKEFDLSAGKITAVLATMYIKLVERYSQRSNWRGYTYIDEMRGQALLQLAQIGLQFNEDKSDNPFAYYTTVVNNSFTRVLNIEKKNQGIRDDLLEKAGQAPSWTRQLAHEMKSQERWQKVVKTKITDDAIPTETIKEIYADND